MKNTNKMPKVSKKKKSKPVLPAVFSVYVSWKEFNEEDKSDLEAQRLFEKSIIGYVEVFNSLPPVGLMIGNGSCDNAEIKELVFNGIDNSIFVHLAF